MGVVVVAVHGTGGATAGGGGAGSVVLGLNYSNAFAEYRCN